MYLPFSALKYGRKFKLCDKTSCLHSADIYWISEFSYYPLLVSASAPAIPYQSGPNRNWKGKKGNDMQQRAKEWNQTIAEKLITNYFAN